MHIGISGPIASGKSTLGKDMKAVFELLGTPTRIVPFAEDLKWMASLYGSTEVIPQLRTYFMKLGYNELTAMHGIAEVLNAFMLFPPVDGVKPRRLFQYIGTEAGRYTVDKDLWITAVQQKINESTEQLFISDDMRFPNEALAVDFHVRISVLGGVATEKAYEARKALYPVEYFYSDHDSEQEVLPTADYTIRTDFTTVDVIELVKTINHRIRSSVVLTQRDFPSAMREFSNAMDGVGNVLRGKIIA